MSRIGNQQIIVPSGVTTTQEGLVLTVQGSRGVVVVTVPHGITLVNENNTITITRGNESKQLKSLHGTVRALVANAVHGVANGWDKQLELVGVGYRAQTNGKELTLTVGYSHPVKMIAPEGIQFAVVENKITVSGFNKELVGQIAAKIRKVRPPEPYKGKGIRYVGEVVRKKVGKAAKAVGGSS